MKSRKILICILLVLSLTGGAAWWILHLPENTADVLAVDQASRQPSTKPAPVTSVSVEAPVADPAQGTDTVSGLLLNDRLGEREVVAGLARIVRSPARVEEHRNEALSHLLNLTSEDDETTLAGLARDPALTQGLARRLFEDAFNRDHGWQVDLCLVLLERKDMKLLHSDLREHLVFLVGPDVPADSDLNTLKRAGDAAKKRWAEQAAQ